MLTRYTNIITFICIYFTQANRIINPFYYNKLSTTDNITGYTY